MEHSSEDEKTLTFIFISSKYHIIHNQNIESDKC